MTLCDPLAAMVPPFAKFEANTEAKPDVIDIPVTVKVELPLFAIVNVNSLLWPTSTLPNAKLPLTAMMRVGDEGVGEGDGEGVGEGEGVGDVGDEEPPQPATNSKDRTPTEANTRIRPNLQLLCDAKKFPDARIRQVKEAAD